MQPEPDELQSCGPAESSGGPETNRRARPIAELVDAEDFPRCALGELVDIGGYTGVISDIVSHSLKVRSAEGVTKSFNVGGLRRIYGRPIPPPPIPTVEAPAEPAAPPAPPPPVTIQPDFSRPVRPISDYVKKPDYPHCVLGEHVQIADYSGVVVQIVNRSLKVRSPAEITRSYNADALRRLHAAG